MKNVLKKSLIAASLVSLGYSAHAEGFNFYALVDGGFGSTSINKGGTTKGEFVTGGYAPTFMGMSSEKSLGKGLTGGFKLEQGFLLTGKSFFGEYASFGPDALFNRQANVYVKGDFGTVTIGTQGNIAFDSVLLGEPRAGSNFGSALATIDLDGGLGTVDKGALTYKSPSLSGTSLALAYVPAQGTSKATSRLAATYSGKEGAASIATYEDKPVIGTASKGTIYSGNYKLGAFTLKGLYVTQKNGALTKLSTLGGGGAYALSPETTLDFGIYDSKDSAAHYKVATMAGGVQYKFLKDLTLYGQYASAKNKGTKAAAWNFAGPSSAFLTSAITAGQTASTINVGLLYAFF